MSKKIKTNLKNIPVLSKVDRIMLRELKKLKKLFNPLTPLIKTKSIPVYQRLFIKRMNKIIDQGLKDLSQCLK